MDRYIYELTDALIDTRKIARKKGRRKTGRKEKPNLT
jgi:hypothetical protein